MIKVAFFSSKIYNISMKKGWKILIGLLLFAGMVTLCYFFGYVRNDIDMAEGKYYLTEISIQRENENNPNVTEILSTEEDGYILVLADNKLESHLLTNVTIEQGKIYDCKIVGTGLTIYDGKQSTRSGLYVEKTIFITIEKEEEIDGEKIKVSERYRYDLKEE